MPRPVSEWPFELALRSSIADDAPDAEALPAFLRIARAIADDARTGRLGPGARLPGSRELADSIGVHRNTVLAAYRELASEGFLETEQGRGTYLARTLPEVKARRWQRKPSERARATRAGFDFEPVRGAIESEKLPPGTLALYGGLPDTRLLPRAAIARAYRRALNTSNALLGYGDAQGEPRLREAIAEMLRATRGLVVSADDVLITRGSQMALSLLGQVLVRPGDRVAVEAFGYPPAWRALVQHAGVTLVPIPLDAEGLDVSALAAEHAREPIRAVYVTPHHQYPTTVTMSASRRMALLALARKERFAIVEDDYDHEFHYDGRPVLPIASADDGGQVLYVGTLSKSVAPGFRLGFLVAPPAVRDAALAARLAIDRQGDRVSEHAIAELMEDGELQRHLWRARRVYQARRDHFVEALSEAFGDTLEFRVPHGGMAIWARVDRAIDLPAWHARSLARGVTFHLGRRFRFDGRDTPHVRLGYAVLDEREMSVAVRKMREALHERRGR